MMLTLLLKSISILFARKQVKSSSVFHSRCLNNKINSIHARALKVTYQDNRLTFQELLNKDNSTSMHHRNLHVLETKMFKIH